MSPNLKKSLIVPISILCISALTLVSLAWFAGVLNPGSLGFKTGSNATLPEIQMWMYTSVEDIDGVENAETGWETVEVTIPEDAYDVYVMPAAPSTTTEATDESGTYTKHSFVMEQLHFGVIDNLISLKEDNVIYLRLKVNAATTGRDSMTFRFAYDTATEGVLTKDDLYNAISLYDGEGKEAEESVLQDKIRFDECVTDAEGNLSLDTETEASESGTDVTPDSGKLKLHGSARFLQISAAATGDGAITPDADNFKDLEFTEFVLIGDTGYLDLKNVTPDTDGYYYVYLKLAPNLDFFVLQEHLLDQFIPAHIFFNGKIELEMH